MWHIWYTYDCNTLQDSVIPLLCVAAVSWLKCSVLWCVTVCCSQSYMWHDTYDTVIYVTHMTHTWLQHSAIQWSFSTLRCSCDMTQVQCVAVCCSHIYVIYDTHYTHMTAKHCNTFWSLHFALQPWHDSSALCCSVLQCIAVIYVTHMTHTWLQHTAAQCGLSTLHCSCDMTQVQFAAVYCSHICVIYVTHMTHTWLQNTATQCDPSILCCSCDVTQVHCAAVCCSHTCDTYDTHMTATHCNIFRSFHFALQPWHDSSVVCCSVLQCIAVIYVTHITHTCLQHTATQCGLCTLRCSCDMTQVHCVVVCCSALQSYMWHIWHTHDCDTLQHSVVSALRVVAVPWLKCSVL